MARTVFRDGPASVVLDGDLEGFVRRAAEAASGGALEVLEREGEELADAAAQAWYGPTGVSRKTGLGGKVEAITTISDVAVTVSIGSTDPRKDPKSGKPSVVYVHRPRAFSLIEREVTRDEWWGWKRKGLPVGAYDQGGRYFVKVTNPAASDGAFLIPELVRKPVKAKLKAIASEIGAKIAAKVTRG